MSKQIRFSQQTDRTWTLIGFDGDVWGNFDNLKDAKIHASWFFNREDIRDAQVS